MENRNLSLLNTGKSNLEILILLAWPAIAEQLLFTLASYVDTAMVGSLGAGATAAVAINTSSVWLITGLLTAIGVGYSVQVAHCIGAEDLEGTRRVIRQAVLATVVVGVALAMVFCLFSPYIPRWLGADATILEDAQRYLLVYALALPLQAALAVFSAILRCMGDTRSPLFFNTAANLLNIVLNYFMIFEARPGQLFGMDIMIPGAGWGVTGAAIATSISQGLAGLILLLIAFRRRDSLRISLHDDYRPDRTIIRRAVNLGVPVAMERLTISVGQLVMTRIVSSLGTIALAANHVAVTAEGISYLPAYGVGFAATTLVGQALGAKKPKEARHFAWLSTLTGLVFCLVGGLLLFLFATPLSAIFSSDPQVVELAAQMLRIVAISEPMFGISIVMSGALRGAGDSRFPFYIVVIGMWCVRVILAPVLVFIFHMGLAGIWIAMVVDLVIRGILCLLRYRVFHWNSLPEPISK